MKHAMCAIKIPYNPYKETLINVHDRLCEALTCYEAADNTDDYDKGYELYQDIVKIEEELSEFIN